MSEKILSADELADIKRMVQTGIRDSRIAEKTKLPAEKIRWLKGLIGWGRIQNPPNISSQPVVVKPTPPPKKREVCLRKKEESFRAMARELGAEHARWMMEQREKRATRLALIEKLRDR